MTSNETRSLDIYCPYCGESFNAIIDCSVATQSYIEDCQVCCCPIRFEVEIDDDADPRVAVFTDSE